MTCLCAVAAQRRVHVSVADVLTHYILCPRALYCVACVPDIAAAKGLLHMCVCVCSVIKCLYPMTACLEWSGLRDMNHQRARAVA